MNLAKIYIVGMALICQSFACQPIPNSQIPDSITTQHLWVLPRNEGAIVNGRFPQFIHGNNLITHIKKNGQTQIVAVDKNSSKEIWSWSDLFTQQEESQTDDVHIFENILVWRSVRRVYAINLLTGQTVWRQNIMSNIGFGADNITGLGNRFLFPSARITYFSGLTRTGNISIGPILQYNGNINLVISSSPKMFLNEQPNFIPQASLFDTLVVLTHTDAEGEGANVFNLYNLTQDKFIYTKTIPGDTSGAFSHSPSIHSGKIYFPAGPVILCFDLKTGNELWRTRFSSITTSALLIVNNKIYSTNENRTTYCLDVETGKILWQTGTRGGASKPFFMNGVIYFTSIADGNLYGLDAATGAILMKIEDPRGGIGFQDVVTGADGKIYASTWTHLYCFKAAR